MIRKTFLAAAALAALATPSLADAGKDQYAAALGVDSNLYTMSELIRLDDAISENDRTTVEWIVNGGLKANAPEDPARVTPSEAQLAASLGLDPAQYTSAELSALYTAKVAD